MNHGFRQFPLHSNPNFPQNGTFTKILRQKIKIIDLYHGLGGTICA